MDTIELFRLYRISNGYMFSSVNGESQTDEFVESLSDVLVRVAAMAGDSLDAAATLDEAYREARDEAFNKIKGFTKSIKARPIGADTVDEEEVKEALDNLEAESEDEDEL